MCQYLSILLFCLVPGAHAEPSGEFGAGWDNPRTAAPPVERPPAQSCTVQIVDHGFAVRDEFTGNASYTAQVPREQRHAVGESSATYQAHASDGRCCEHHITQRNGFVTQDRAGCR